VRTFRHRADAGAQLATALADYAARPDLTVLALPRGGVPVAAEVARALGAPLDLCLVRKLGVPGHPELAMGAIAPGGIRVLSAAVIRDLAISDAAVGRVADAEGRELERRVSTYGGRVPPDLRGRLVVLVDDGLATGATMEAAVLATRRQEPSGIVVAVPVGTREAVARLGSVADSVVCLDTPERFTAVGQWYDDFTQTTDAEVLQLLAVADRAARPR
jgi:predicted phosphoribosyltransferase